MRDEEEEYSENNERKRKRKSTVKTMRGRGWLFGKDDGDKRKKKETTRGESGYLGKKMKIGEEKENHERKMEKENIEKKTNRNN